MKGGEHGLVAIFVFEPVSSLLAVPIPGLLLVQRWGSHMSESTTSSALDVKGSHPKYP